MIVVDLMCEHEHRFEGWFASSDDVESQQQRGLLTCPLCNSREVRRLPSAPHIQRSGAEQEADAHASIAPTSEPKHVPHAESAEAQQLLQLLMQKLQESAVHSEDVGEDFTVEVRRIHFGDAEARAIRGLATAQDVAGLLDEGISVLPLPVTKENLH